MASISTTGIGSGIDISGLVESLLEAERVPTETRIDSQEADLLAQLSAFGTLKSALSSFQDSLSQLKFASTFEDVTVSSSDDALITASGTSIANPGNYSLEIDNLAQAHSLSSTSFDETTDPVGTGTLTFEFGHFDSDSNSFISNPDKSAKTVTIDNDDNSLQGIRDAVNLADIDVTASLVNDGSGFKLLFTSDDTGEANGLKITVTDDADNDDADASGLSQLAFDPDPANAASSHLAENLAAKDAAFSLNGLAITSSSNSVTTAISGVTINLKGTTETGSPVNLNINKNDDNIIDSINSFTEKFNELVDTISQLSDFDNTNVTAGPLLGDSTLRSIDSQIRKFVSNSVASVDGNITSLATIGITTDRNGKLSTDSSKLETSLSENRDIVAQIFSAKGISTESQINFITSSDKTKTGDYTVLIDVAASRGTLQGTAVNALSDLTNSPLTIDSNNNSLSLIVDGIASGTINLTEKAYSSGSELASEIQNQINASNSLKDNGSSVLVSFDNGSLQISSALYGSQSSVEITSIESSNDLGFSIGAGTQGKDVSGTIGGQSASGSGNILTAQGDASGMVLEVTGTATGNRGSIFFNRGIADQLDNLVGQFLAADNLIDSREDGINTRIERLNQQRSDLDEKLSSLESRLFQQFNAMDIIVAQLQTTGNFLEQQLSSLPGVVQKDK